MSGICPREQQFWTAKVIPSSVKVNPRGVLGGFGSTWSEEGKAEDR